MLTKINKPGVIFTDAVTVSPKTPLLDSTFTLVLGLVLELGVKGEHLRLLAGF